ncbi:MAG: hypothetical protein H0U60_01115 [Blastocatellia bacterium]|nr:hypothetical protein [Blastocatellia bacterium]
MRAAPDQTELHVGDAGAAGSGTGQAYEEARGASQAAAATPTAGMYIPTATTAVNEMAESDTSLANNTGHFNLLITPALNSSHFNTKSVGGQTKLIQLVSRMGNRGRHIGVKPYSAESRP